MIGATPWTNQGTSRSKRQNGTVQVIGALEKFATYFDDAGFKPIEY